MFDHGLSGWSAKVVTMSTFVDDYPREKLHGSPNKSNVFGMVLSEDINDIAVIEYALRECC